MKSSLAVAEILVPWLQKKFIRKPIYKIEQEAVESGKKKTSFFTSLQNGYNKLADLCFSWPKTTIVLGLLVTALGIWLFMKCPMQLMPIAERNQFAVEIYLPTGSSLDRTNQVTDSLERILLRDERITSVASFHGCSSPRFQTTYAPQVGGPNYAQFIVNTVSEEATIEALNDYTDRYESYFPEAICRFKQLSYSDANYPIEIRISGDDFAQLQSVADSVLSRIRKVPGVRLARSNTDLPLVGAKVITDHTSASRLGINDLMLESTLASRYSSGIPVATVWEGDYGLDVTVKTDRSKRADYGNLINEQIPVFGVKMLR